MSEPYDDIINLPHPTSRKHPRMDLMNRAAQFSPFAALTGHDAAIRETARLTERRPELAEDTKTALDRKLRMAAEQKSGYGDDLEITITYFKKDPEKEGGSFETTVGRIRKINDYDRVVVLGDGRRIAIDDIFEIESELFRLF